MENITAIFLILFAAGTFFVALLEYVRKLIKDTVEKNEKK